MLQINNARTAKKSARALEKFLAKNGIILEHGKALDAMSVLAGFKDWNSLSYAVSVEGIDAQLADFEHMHIDGSGDATYGEEQALRVHTGFELRYGAVGEVDYVRVCDPLGREVAYWVVDEWEQMPGEVMGAILGALGRGRAIEYVDNRHQQASAVSVVETVRIQDVPFDFVSNLLVNDVPYSVTYRNEEILAMLHAQEGDPDEEDDLSHGALDYCNNQGHSREGIQSISLHTLRSLSWNAMKDCFVSANGDTYVFYVEQRFKPTFSKRAEAPDAKPVLTTPTRAVTVPTPKAPAVAVKSKVELYEVMVSASAKEGQTAVGVWVGGATSTSDARCAALNELWDNYQRRDSMPVVSVSHANEQEYGPFSIFVDNAYYAEVPYFRTAVETAEAMLEVGNICTVTALDGARLYTAVK